VSDVEDGSDRGPAVECNDRGPAVEADAASGNFAPRVEETVGDMSQEASQSEKVLAVQAPSSLPFIGIVATRATVSDVETSSGGFIVDASLPETVERTLSGFTLEISSPDVLSPPQSEPELDDVERCQSEESLDNGTIITCLVDDMDYQFFCCSTEASTGFPRSIQQSLDLLPSADLTSGAKEGLQEIVFQEPVPSPVFTSTQSPSLPKEVKPQWVRRRHMQSSGGALQGF